MISTAQMNTAQGKSPVGLLQELCTKRGLNAKYELEASEGPVHERVFVFRVTAGELMATGRGIPFTLDIM